MSFDYEELNSRFKEVINNPERLKEMNYTSTQFLNSLSWKKTGEEFVKILKSI